MKFIKYVAALWLVAPFVVQAIGQVGNHPLIVPGSELGWESARLELVLRVSEPTPVKFSVYSPGFDPSDYRSPKELGDERYDGGRDELKTILEIFDENGTVRLRKSWGNEPHRWYKLIDGVLEPGNYLITVKFFGNGKNALAFKLDGDPAKVILQVAPGSMQTYNVHGPKWVYPFALNKRGWTAPLVVGIYDGDGPRELEVRARRPGGVEEDLPSPPNGGWVRYPVEKEGVYRFGFRQPETAKQYTNTVGFEIFLGDVVVEVVDEKGRSVEGADYTLTGYYDRTVHLTRIPEGWTHVATVATYGKKLAEDKVLFGPGGGRVRFVLRPRLGVVEVKSLASCGGERIPAPVTVSLGDHSVELDARGEAVLKLPVGRYPVSVQAVGARVQAPDAVDVVAGGPTRVELIVEPQLELDLDVTPAVLAAGDRLRVFARLSTAYPHALPAELQLAAPAGLRFEGPPEVRGSLQAGRPLELVVAARAETPGSYEITAISRPCVVKATARVEVRRPATFALQKEALTPEVPLGGEARFRVRVTNEGERPGSVHLRDVLPAGLNGDGLDERFTLDPGAARTFEIVARVAATSTAQLVNTAVLYDPTGRELVRSSAGVRVLPPDVALTRSLDKHLVVPGEMVNVCLQVANTGRAPLVYTLSDRAPDWIKPIGEPQFKGELDPGAKTEHCYQAKVTPGPAAEGRFMARLNSNAGERTAPDTIRRVPLQLEKSVSPEQIVLGGTAVFTVAVSNPTDHALTVRLQEVPDTGLGMEAETKTIELAPGERRELSYPARPSATGRFKNQAFAYVNEASVSAEAMLLVRPQITARRVSEVRLSFQVEGQGDGLLIAHQPPEGARYRLGSSRLDGVPIDEPRQTEDGRLIWKLPFVSKGTLSYELEHQSALPPLPEPALTLLAGDHEVSIQGEVHEREYRQARPLDVQQREGMIRAPLPGSVVRGADAVKVHVVAPYGNEVELSVNGEVVGQDRLGEAIYDIGKGVQELHYYDVPLAVGANRIEVSSGERHDVVEVFRAGRPVRLVAVPERVVADGRTPLRLRIETRDELGFASGMGFVTVESSVEPVSPDANLQMSGYQVLIKDGEGELVLHPVASPKMLHIKLAKDNLESEVDIYVPGTKTTLWAAQGSVTVRYGGSFEVGGRAYGYLESPLAGGTIQGALGVNVTDNAGSILLSPNLTNPEDNPYRRFPLLGSGEASKLPLQSDDGIAVKYDREDFSIGYYKTNLSLPGVSGLPTATALVANKRGDLQAAAFVALLPSGEVSEEIVPDGTRVYKLSHAVKPGSEKVVLQRGAIETDLVPLKDYVIDYPTGHITLATPLWPNDENLVPVRLLVSYSPAKAPRDTLAFGAGASYRIGSFTIGVAAASLDSGATWKYGAALGYRRGPFSVSMSMSTPSVDDGWSYDVSSSYTSNTLKMNIRYSLGTKNVATLAASGRQGRFSMSGNLRYDGSLSGKLRVAASVSKSGKVVIEHRGSSTSNRSALLYEQSLGSLNAGLGVGYEWQTASPSAVGRLGYGTDKIKISATHRQSFSVAPSLSTLNFSYLFDSNLKGAGELAYEWGAGLKGTFGLYQKLGPANLSLSYALPNASGEGNRARFGVQAPLPLGKNVTLDLSAGYERDLGTGAYQTAIGTSIRYKVEDLTASFGIEGATGSLGDKLTLRSGATGRLNEKQVVSFDANYIYESSWHGRFTLAYAFRGKALQLLTYHRMINENGASFEGEVAPTWHPNLAFQLRPSAAYRVSLNDPASSLYQVGIGANYYFSPRIGLGAGAYYLVQPALAKSSLSFSVEGSFRIIDPVWFNLGYTFGGFYGLMPESRPGIYVRLDFLSAPDIR